MSPVPQAAAQPKGTHDEALLCDVSRNGRLIERGRDPLSAEVSIQTDQVAPNVISGILSAFGGVPQGPGSDEGTASPGGASPKHKKVLDGAVRQLDLAAHPERKPWAEAWLAGDERAKLGLDEGGPGSWKQNALHRLRELQAQGSGSGMLLGGRRDGPERAGPDLGEHLETAAYALERVMHSVEILQAPEQHYQQMVTKEFTNEMVKDVCGDLRQWLEQLADVMPLYHVHIVDIETERRRLTDRLGASQAELRREKEAHRREVHRHEATQKLLEDTKMRQQASALLGIEIDDDDSLVYSRNDVARMKEEWQEEWQREFEEKKLQPLMDEIAELRQLRDSLQERLRMKSEMDSLSKANLAPEFPKEELLEALQALTQASMNFPELYSAVMELEKAAQNPETSSFAEVAARFKALPDLVRAASRHSSIHCDEGGPLVAVAEQLGALEVELRTLDDPRTDGLQQLLSWACSAMPGARGEAAEAPPAWDVDFLRKRAAARSSQDFGVNTEGDGFGVGKKEERPDDSALKAKLREEIDAMYRARIESMKAEFARQLQEERDKAAEERARFEQLVADLQADLKKAEARAKELKTRLLDMQRMMKAKGLGDAFNEALKGSGVSDFLMEGGVFQRLYADALIRMKRWAQLKEYPSTVEPQPVELDPRPVFICGIPLHKDLKLPQQGSSTAAATAGDSPKKEPRKPATLSPSAQRQQPNLPPIGRGGVAQDPLSISTVSPRSPGSQSASPGHAPPRGVRGMQSSASMPHLIGAGRPKLLLA